MAEPEIFIEYATRYPGREPGRYAWSQDYDDAVRDYAKRCEIHKDIGPLELVQRTVTILTTDWVPAVKPDASQREAADKAAAEAVTVLNEAAGASTPNAVVTLNISPEDFSLIARDASWEGKKVTDYLVDHARGRTRKGC